MLSHTYFLPRTKARRTISGRQRLLVPLAAAGILMSAVGCPKLPSAAGTPADIGGVGVMGDSMSDEYRADNNRGGAFASSAFNWVEILVRKGYSFGSWGKRPEPRRVGYGYNWARSGARAADLPTQAQSLAAQVADGRVRNVIILIGANDFASWNGTYGEIYYNKITDAQVSGKVKKMVADITAAVDTVRASRTVPMVISTIPNRSVTQPFLDRYPDPAKRKRVTNAIRAVNDGIIAMATAKGIAVADLFAFSTELPTRADTKGNVPFGGGLINIRVPGDEPHHLLLWDNEHIGTVFNGRLANLFMYEGLGSKYPLLRPISDAAILSLAGI